MTDQAAFDQLPPAIREAVREGSYNVNCKVLLARHLRGYTEAELLRDIANWRRASAAEAIARGVPPELAGWPPIVSRAGKTGRPRLSARTG